MTTINELETVALTCDLPKHGLLRGDVGTAVLVHGGGVAFEVEFVGYDGHTVALLTLERGQVRPLDTSNSHYSHVTPRRVPSPGVPISSIMSTVP
ncbi:MAG: DUF4926 domain-containing protein, partial [Verrucomicrobia bacterium]|nr:DUF4926 domain-containing protein [Verrucomicrobiota bacterium]